MKIITSDIMKTSKITIVHVTDLHVKAGCNFDLEKRVEAFCKDIDDLFVKPSFIVVSGDITYSGKKEEFDLAWNSFFVPLLKKTGLSESSIILAPGNHDYDRAKIPDVIRDGITAQLNNCNFSSLLDDAQFREGGEKGFYDFVTAHGFINLGANVIANGPLDVGVAVFATARSCVGRESKRGTVYLAPEDIKQKAYEIRGCGLKMAIMHHPLDWFSDTQKNVVDLLKSEFDLILCGHIHEGDSELDLSPNSSLIYGVSSAFMRGTERSGTDGYNIYEIDTEERTFTAKYRQYVDKRSEYDSDNLRAKGGMFEWYLPKNCLSRQGTMQLRTLEVDICHRLNDEVKTSLSKSQHLDSPIYIEPHISQCELDDNGREIIKKFDKGAFTRKYNIFYAPSDVGVTTYFKKSCAKINEQGCLSVIIAGTRLKDIRNEDSLRKYVAKQYGLNSNEINLSEVALFVDDFVCRDKDEFQGFMDLLGNVKQTYISIRNQLLFDGLIRSIPQKGVGFYKFGYWSARKVKEFIELYVKSVGGSSLDINAVIRFIVKSLSNTDIPLSPLLVGLYVHAFVEGQGAFTSLNFGELMNNIESRCLGVTAQSNTNTVHYYQLLLQMIARACLRKESLIVPREEAIREFVEHIKKCGMEDNVEQKIRRLEEVGLLVEVENSPTRDIGFPCFMFFRHYLSYSFDDGFLDVDDYLSNPGKVSEIGDALPYYIARHRNCIEVIDKLMMTAEKYFPPESVTPEVLEQYATSLIAPVESKSAESKASEISSQNLDTPIDDEEMDHRRNAKAKSEQGSFSLMKSDNEVYNLDARIDFLGVLYNVFRNLEEIPFEDKIRLIDRVMDFHLSCNMKMIDYFAQATGREKGLTSLFAYLTTLGGTGFLSENIASSNLKKTIREAYNLAINPLKKLLLLCVEMELGMSDYVIELPRLLEMNDVSIPIIEIGYFKLMDSLIFCKKDSISAEQVEAFKKVYDIRKGHYGRRTLSSNGDAEFDDIIKCIKKSHLVQLQDLKKGDVSDITTLITK